MTAPKQIAGELAASDRTVEFHRAHVMEKVQATRDWIASEAWVRSAGDVADIVRRTGVRMLLRVDAGDLGKWTA